MKWKKNKPSEKKVMKEKTATRRSAWNKRRLMHGSYSAALTVFVVAGVLVINLIAGALPSQYTKLDVTDQKLSVIGDQTKEILSGLENDITLYYVVQDGNRDDNVARLLERYDDFSDRVTVEEKDPVLNPKFASQYTEEGLTDNSVIVVSGEKSRVVAYEDMYESEFNYSYYMYETTGFDAEGQLTSAIAAVSSDDLPKLYTLTGHDELSVSDTLAKSVEKANIEMESLNLVTAESVPEDAACLLIVSPASDISAEESEKILDYLKSGGRAAVITDYTGKETPNLDAVLEYYGTQRTDGVVVEGDSNHYVQVPYYIVPDIVSTEITEDMSNNNVYVLLAAAQGLEISDDLRDNLSVTGVLSTSDNSYSKTDVENMTTYDQEEGDIEGPFYLGALISEELEDTEETRLVVFTSSALLDDSANSMVSGGNSRLFLNALGWLCGQESSASVPVKSLTSNYLTLTSSAGSFWSIVTIGLVPGAFLLYGLFVWLRRRKK